MKYLSVKTFFNEPSPDFKMMEWMDAKLQRQEVFENHKNTPVSLNQCFKNTSFLATICEDFN